MIQRASKADASPLFVVRNSEIHGKGAYALRPIPKGARIVEYQGDIVTWKEVMKKASGPDSEPDDGVSQIHTFLFEIDPLRVIDASRRDWPAKWINHSCDPNCTAVGEGSRIFINALRTIRRGEELTYDYKITLEERHTAAVKKRYACRCGTRKCRGTILAAKH